MNNARLWLVVNPTVGIPIFLGAVAIGSFSVHVAVLSNTTWVSDFLSGKELGSSSASLEQPLATADADAKVFFDTASANADKATVVLPDGRSASVVFDAPEQTALVVE
ncbi:MAG: light-harvesting protein [Pseudomonadota bacterium]